MTLEHAAIWTDDLELLKDFYIKYFEATANNQYSNPVTGFKSYFLSFKSGARLEIMMKPGIPENTNDTVEKQHKGIIHLAFAVDTREEVEKMASLLQADGIKILRGPRVTGDGYYEFEMLDPDNNRLEVCTKA